VVDHAQNLFSMTLVNFKALKPKIMKSYKIESVTAWSTQKLKSRVEHLLQERTGRNWQILSISFGINIWWMPTAYITFIQP